MLKSAMLSAFFICSVLFTGHSQEMKLSKEEEAIKSVIEAESEHFWARDYDKWMDLWVHESYSVWTSASKSGVRRYDGWDAWSTEVKNLFKEDPDPQPYEGVVYKYNYRFRIYGKGAWVSFEQMNDGTKTYETRIMEKHGGKWKIAMVEVIYNINEPLEEDTETGG
jgi:hypothetical protein